MNPLSENKTVVEVLSMVQTLTIIEKVNWKSGSKWSHIHISTFLFTYIIYPLIQSFDVVPGLFLSKDLLIGVLFSFLFFLFCINHIQDASSSISNFVFLKKMQSKLKANFKGIHRLYEHSSVTSLQCSFLSTETIFSSSSYS